MLMKADLEMERFLNDPRCVAAVSPIHREAECTHSQIRLPIQPPFFAPANTFQRLLIHRLADSFGLTRILDASTPLSPTMTSGLPSQGMTGTLILVKTPQSRVCVTMQSVFLSSTY